MLLTRPMLFPCFQDCPAKGSILPLKVSSMRKALHALEILDDGEHGVLRSWLMRWVGSLRCPEKA